jgi:hypothetical protein
VVGHGAGIALVVTGLASLIGRCHDVGVERDRRLETATTANGSTPPCLARSNATPEDPPTAEPTG